MGCYILCHLCVKSLVCAEAYYYWTFCVIEIEICSLIITEILKDV